MQSRIIHGNALHCTQVMEPVAKRDVQCRKNKWNMNESRCTDIRAINVHRKNGTQ